MKITDIKVYIMDAYRTNWTFIKVETDEGLYGWGEASLGTQEMALKGCVEDLKRLIIGRNPLEIERMRFEVYRDIYWKGGFTAEIYEFIEFPEDTGLGDIECRLVPWAEAEETFKDNGHAIAWCFEQVK